MGGGGGCNVEIQICLEIPDHDHGSYLEILQMTSPPEPYVGLFWNLVGVIVAIWRFKIAWVKVFRINSEFRIRGVKRN